MADKFGPKPQALHPVDTITNIPLWVKLIKLASCQKICGGRRRENCVGWVRSSYRTQPTPEFENWKTSSEHRLLVVTLILGCSVCGDQDHADQPPPPPPAHHVVVRQPRLHPADAAILRDLVGSVRDLSESVRDLSGRVDRLEGMMRWMTERMAASAGMDIPVFPGPGHHQDPQDPGGHA
ncbi:hypothetical protein R6Q59_022803 [Mikania micrantha]